MCGRAYHTYTEEELDVRMGWEKLKRKPLGFKPNYNMSPTQSVPVILVRDDKQQLELFRWGLVPFWAKDVASAAKYSLINARSEEITEKRSYAQAFQKRRCLVPLSGFIEWIRPPEGSKAPKRPFAIHLKDAEIMSVAGVWEHWESKETGDRVDSFSILTTEANSFMAKIHDRMPVILDKRDEKAWLDPSNQKTESLKKFLKPCATKWLDAFEVSTAINSPKNNSPKVLEPLKLE